MTECVQIKVTGQPIPQGSVSSFRGRVVAVKAELRKWRDAIRAASLEQWGDRPPIDRPVTIWATFVLPEPQRPRWPVPAVKPDLDKLTRAVGDALTNNKDQRGILAEDSRIIGWHVHKVYGDPGVFILIMFS
jgi:Holliday junction resolvase RusA-like endonuclease